MSREFRITGPPGTGKTTFLAHTIRKAREKYDAQDIVACSFTRAAAVEIAGRDTGLPRQNVGTVHSLCYHALGCPQIAEVTPDAVKAWNNRNRNPDFHIRTGRRSLDEPPDSRQVDFLMNWNRRRAVNDPTVKPHTNQEKAWEQFKAENDLVDFTDLLLRAPKHIGAKVLMFDEAQDANPLMLSVVRQWGQDAETFIMAGDVHQTLYDWLGADPAALMTPLPPEQRRCLSQSHRLPRAVWEQAEQWIRKLGSAREEQNYQPRSDGGEVRQRNIELFRKGNNITGLAREITDVAQEKSVMVLASCSYMLSPLLRELKRMGTPFGNTYRKERGDWNPLRAGRRLTAFLDCCERWVDVPPEKWLAWVDMIPSKGNLLQRGAKAGLKALASRPGERVTEELLEQWFTPELLTFMADRNVSGLRMVCRGSYRKMLNYPVRVLERSGRKALEATPGLTVGTIHSVKGGEADCVYVWPDMSWQAEQSVRTGGQAARHSLVRLAYVAMTRARESVHLCAPSGKFYWRW